MYTPKSTQIIPVISQIDSLSVVTKTDIWP